MHVAGALIRDDRLCTVYFQIHSGTHMQDLRTHKREQWTGRDWFSLMTGRKARERERISAPPCGQHTQVDFGRSATAFTKASVSVSARLQL